MASLSPKHPRVILGLMTFGPDEAKGARITSLEELRKSLDYFKARGYNELDTARTYVGGKQEAFTAAAGWKERDLTIATKLWPATPGDHQPENLKALFNKSLSELGTDRADIFYLHAADRSVPFAETLKAVNELYKEGKFSRFGLSNFSAYEIAEIVITCKERGWVRPTVCQVIYNVITRNMELELLPACRRYGLDVVIYNPIVGGLFSGKIKTNEIPKEGRYSSTDEMMGFMYRFRYFKDATFNALAMLEPIVEKHSLTLIETAFRWLVHHSALKIRDGNDGIIIGISKFEQLKNNLDALEKGPLPDEVVKALDDAWLMCKATPPNYWFADLEYKYDTQEALFGKKPI